jgi:hypothetical protein
LGVGTMLCVTTGGGEGNGVRKQTVSLKTVRKTV